jgi:hypothetical protein
MACFLPAFFATAHKIPATKNNKEIDEVAEKSPQQQLR